ncbi:hypothetical protein AB0B89_00485 [Sphaerisporangium sp. NPDC049002]|uniref:hypothetical protein n=1 Tax=Sphaerisporangium sp. NPDC049002 TaxID=3155392 RepID=UPI003411EABE
MDVSIPKTVEVGKQLPLAWTFSDSKLISTADSKAGGSVLITATARVGGLWQGWLDSLGTKDQPQLTAEKTKLELPTALTGAVATSKEGKITITPAEMVLNFSPPAGNTTYNNTHIAPDGPIIAYKDKSGNSPGGWELSDSSKRPGIDDIDGDVHQTTHEGDRVTVTFTGTGLQYITERHALMGPGDVDFPQSKKPLIFDASKEKDGTAVPQNMRRTRQVLWEDLNLDYGTYTATFINKTGAYMLVDGFTVITDIEKIKPELFQRRCRPLVENPTMMTVDVVASSSNGNGSNDGNNGNGQVTDGDDSARGVIVLSGGGQGHGAPTATATATKTAKPTTTSKVSKTPQVRVTPKGGAHTGEAPANHTSSSLLIGYGTTLTLGVIGGLALRRRRAVHGSADRGSLG